MQEAKKGPKQAFFIAQDLNICVKFSASWDGCSLKGDISKEFNE